MTQPFGSGAPIPVEGVTGGPGLPQGVASVDGTTGNVQISAPSNTTQFKKGAVPQALQVYEYDQGPTNFSRIAINTQTNGPYLIRVESQPPAVSRDLTIEANGVVLIGSSGNNPIAFRTNNSSRWQITASGTFQPIGDAILDIGSTTGPFRPRSIIASGAISPGNSLLAGVSLSLFTGTGVPPAGLGANGDVYFNVNGAALTTMYQKRAGAWVGIV